MAAAAPPQNRFYGERYQMIGAGSRAIPFLRSVRIKLLIMLAVLSLPLLVLSLYQLNNYRRSLNDQAATIAHIETNSAANALASWLDKHPALAADAAPSSGSEAENLYAFLQQNTSPGTDAIILVFDKAGRVVPNPLDGGPMPTTTDKLPAGAERLAWSDGVTRLTGARRAEPWGWSVVVGVPVAENTNAGQAIIALAATWAVTLMASILIGFWAVGRFTNPLRKLAASASSLGEGQFHERIEVETEDEVGALAQNFNLMAGQLETKFKELQTQGAFIEEVLDGLPLGVALLDQSLIVRKVNPTFAQAVGRDPQSLAGRGLYEAAAGLAVLSDVVEDVRRSRKPFVAYGLPLNLVVRRTTRDETDEAEGHSFWDVTIWPMMERSDNRGDLLLVLSEVSKRVRAEKLATSAFASERTRAAELETVINQMNEGVIIIDRNTRYKLNPAAAEIIGRRRNDFRDYAQGLITDMALRNMEGRELKPEETPIMRALERREQISGEQLKIARPDGQERVIAISATSLVGEDGQQEGAVAVFRDITEHVKHHDELVAAYDRLREHDRLKSAFVSNISHELRTPLNVIIGLCQLLERDRQLPLAPLQDEAVIRMERNARSLLELVNDLLDYSRLEAGRAALHLENVNVSEVIASIVEDFSAETKDKRIRLNTEVEETLGPILTDRHKLEQVLSNLIGNAVKFTAVGAITISAGALDEERWFLEVSDTGIGISSDALTYIFDEFRQVDDRLARSYGGTGLGLAITRKIVELLEGEISVTSEPEEGSRFRITWPRKVRQRTGTGSLVEKSVPAPTESGNLRARAR
jgi:PAS domain S-box-containing protein